MASNTQTMIPAQTTKSAILNLIIPVIFSLPVMVYLSADPGAFLSIFRLIRKISATYGPSGSRTRSRMPRASLCRPQRPPETSRRPQAASRPPRSTGHLQGTLETESGAEFVFARGVIGRPYGSQPGMRNSPSASDRGC